MSDLDPQPIVYVRHLITHPRHLDAFNSWVDGEQVPTWLSRYPGGSVSRYRSEKHMPWYYATIYELPSDLTDEDARRAALSEIRREWGTWGPNMRDFTAELFEPVWWSGRRAGGEEPHPTIVARFSVEADVAATFDEWQDTVDLPEYIADLPVANIRRYLSPVGDPRFQLQVQEYDSDDDMRTTITSNEPSTRPRYWDGWAKWMPHVNSLSRLVFIPLTEENAAPDGGVWK